MNLRKNWRNFSGNYRAVVKNLENVILKKLNSENWRDVKKFLKKSIKNFGENSKIF